MEHTEDEVHHEEESPPSGGSSGFQSRCLQVCVHSASARDAFGAPSMLCWPSITQPVTRQWAELGSTQDNNARWTLGGHVKVALQVPGAWSILTAVSSDWLELGQLM